MLGSPSLLHAIGNYQGSFINQAKIRLYAKSGILAFSLLSMVAHEELGEYFFTPVVLLGAAADMNFLLYKILNEEIYAMLGLALLETAHNHYWITSEYGSYYEGGGKGKPWDFELGNILIPLIQGFEYTQGRDTSPKYLSRINSVLGVMDEQMWDNDSYGYWSGPERRGKGLSNNLFSERAHRLFYEVSGNKYHLERARRIFVFIEQTLYDGQGHVTHDIVDGEVNPVYCVGCQFYFAKEVYAFEKARNRTAWATAPPAQSTGYGSSSREASNMLNHLAWLFVLTGVLFVFRILKRKN